MSEKDTPHISASVDYLTVTAQGSKATAKLMDCLFNSISRSDLETIRSRKWKFMSYVGHRGEGVRYGVSEHGGIAILSGAQAATLWPLIAPSRSRCTRIDLAVTLSLSEPRIGLATDYYTSLLEQGERYSTVVHNTRGGQTCYVGSRSSEQFGRVYDKGAEQGKKAGYHWRYEVEIKKPRSESVVTTLLGEQHPLPWILAYVYKWFAARGIQPLFESTNKCSAIEILSRISTADTTLQWLSTSVAPSVQRLISNGKREQVYLALGLPLE